MSPPHLFPSCWEAQLAGIRFGVTRSVISLLLRFPQPTLHYAKDHVACKCSREQWVVAVAAIVVLCAMCRVLRAVLRITQLENVAVGPLC